MEPRWRSDSTSIRGLSPDTPLQASHAPNGLITHVWGVDGRGTRGEGLGGVQYSPGELNKEFACRENEQNKNCEQF